MGMGYGAFDFRVRDDPSRPGIHQQHLAGLQPSLFHHIRVRDVAHAGLACNCLLYTSLALSDIDALAVTYAPGLIGALLVGVNFMKGLSYSSGLPLVPVHHLRSHIAANYLAHPDLAPPFLCLVASGGHSQMCIRDR